MTSIDSLARDLERLKLGVLKATTQPRLGHSSVDGQAIELRAPDGSIAGFVGTQFDGTVTAAAVGGTPPPSPTMPLVEPVVGGLKVYWDGTFVDDSYTRVDFRRVTFHAVTDPETLDILSPTQIIGEVHVATGGEVSVMLPAVEHFVYAVAWTDAGKFSYESDPAFGTPLPVVDPTMWADHESRLGNLRDVALPGLQTDLEANEAAVVDLRDVTLPALNARLGAAETDIGGLQTGLTDAEAAALQAQEDAAAAVTQAAAAQAAADGAIRTFGPEEHPTTPPWPNGSAQPANVVGDLWLNADGGAHRWNGTTWYVIPDSAAAAALAAAEDARDVADAAASAASAAQGDVDVLDGRILTAEGEIDSVTTRVTTAEGTLTSVAGRVTNAETAVSSHETRITTAEGTLTSVDGRLDSAESTIGTHATRLTTAEGAIDTVENNVSTINGNVSTLTSRVTTAEGTVTNLDTRIDTAESTISNHTTRLSTAEGNITSVTSIANGKNKTTYSTAEPGTTANTAGDTWFRLSGSEVIGVWNGNGGTSWTAEKFGGAVLDHLDAGTITAGVIAAERIGALSINTGHLAAGAVDAGKIKAGSIDTTKIVTAGLDAATIKFGTMSGARIQTGTLTVGQVVGLQGTLDAKETPSGAQAKATAAQQAAIAASATDAANKATAAETAAKTYAEAEAEAARAAAVATASGDATAKAAAAEAAAKAAAAADALTKANAARDAALAIIDSKATDLIINGTGALGDNTNFSIWTYEGADAPAGARGSFTRPAGSGAGWLDQFIPVDVAKEFQFAFWARQRVATSHPDGSYMYAYLHPHDAFKQNIDPGHYMFTAGTTTTLAAALNPGDTTVTLTSSANWYGSAAKPAGGATHQRRIIWWDYTDPGGKLWPQETYSRNCTNVDLWADGGISGNVITLRAPYAGPAKPAGTKLSNGSSGGTYLYGGAENTVIPTTWTRYTASIKGQAPAGSGAAFSTGWPAGTAMTKVGFLLNRTGPAPWNDPNSQHAIAGVSFSDAAAAQAAAAAAQAQAVAAYGRWAPTGVTTIDGGKITADSITAAQIGADQITANEIAANTITAAEIATDAVTANEIAGRTITALEIATDTITANEIAADTITANEIAANAITANEIAAGAVTADEIAAGAVTADKVLANSIKSTHIEAGAIKATQLDSEVLRAGFVLTGRLDVGQSYWTPEEGIVLPQPDGSSTRFPSDGVTPAQFSGHVRAKSLTVEKDLTLQGNTNQIRGQLRLADGITRPLSAPSVYQSWQVYPQSLLNNEGNAWQSAQGLCETGNPNLYAVAVVYGGATIRLVNRTVSGNWGGDVPNAGGWVDNFYPWGGIGYASGHFYVLGIDYDRGAYWYVYKINETTGAKVAEIALAPPGTFVEGSGACRVTANANNGAVYVAYVTPHNGAAHLRSYNLNLVVTNDVIFNSFGAGITRHISGLYVGPADTGEQRIWALVAEDRKIYSWRLSDNTIVMSDSFGPGGSGSHFGLTWDISNARFVSYDVPGNIYRYSTHRSDKAVTAAYTWYDGNGTVRETEPSPQASFTLPARSHLTVETPLAPDSGITDPLRVDKANRIGIYVGVSGGARRLQSHLGVDANGASYRKLTLDAIGTTGALEPVTNTFADGQTSPGRIDSAAGGFILNGDGTGAWPALRPAGEITMYGGAAAPTGWLLCQGQVVNRADYPALFTAIGTTFNTGGETAAQFRLPDLRARSPLGSGVLSPDQGTGYSFSLGMKYGVQRHVLTVNELPDHTHSLPMSASGAPAGTGDTPLRSSGVSDGSFRTGAEVATGSGYGSGLGSNGSHENMHPTLAVNFIIKT